MKKFILFAALFFTLAASYTPAPVQALEDCDITLGEPKIIRTFQNSELVYQEQLCAALATGVVTYTEWIDGVTPVSRIANSAEIIVWIEHVLKTSETQSLSDSRTSLNSDVDGNQKWIPKLREWENDAQDYYDSWPTLSDNAKDNVNREMLRRMGLTWGGLADLLTILEVGN